MRIKPMVKDFIYPVYKTAGAAAFDIFLQQDLTLTPNEPVTIKLVFATGMEDGYYAAIAPRASVGMMYGVCVWNTVGVIDSDFEGGVVRQAGLQNSLLVQARGQDFTVCHSLGLPCHGHRRGE